MLLYIERGVVDIRKEFRKRDNKSRKVVELKQIKQKSKITEKYV